MKIVAVKCDNTMIEIDWESRTPLTEYYGADITFVGQISSNIVVIGKKNNSNENVNTFVENHHDMFDTGTRGEILLIGTNDDGSEVDLNIETVIMQLKTI